MRILSVCGCEKSFKFVAHPLFLRVLFLIQHCTLWDSSTFCFTWIGCWHTFRRLCHPSDVMHVDVNANKFMIIQSPELKSEIKMKIRNDIKERERKQKHSFVAGICGSRSLYLWSLVQLWNGMCQMRSLYFIVRNSIRKMPLHLSHSIGNASRESSTNFSELGTPLEIGENDEKNRKTLTKSHWNVEKSIEWWTEILRAS